MPAGQIHTRGGDGGTCGLLGNLRVHKDHPRVECLGELDEVNSTIGLLRSKVPVSHSWQPRLQGIQRNLMDAMSNLATPAGYEGGLEMPFPMEATLELEEWLDEIEERLPSTTDSFLLPGGSEVSALCHVVRTQVRRAERRIATLHQAEPVAVAILSFVNRLSDVFFKLAREELAAQDIPEEKWKLFVYKA